MVSIHRPLGYGPSTLPLRHAALYGEVTENRYSLKGKPIISKGDEFNAQYSKEKAVFFPFFSHQHWATYFFFHNSSVAQWKRAGPITQRSMDRNHPLLHFFLFFFFSFFKDSCARSFPFHHVPLIAQLVERRTVVGYAEILRSLVRIRLEALLFFSMPFSHSLSCKNCAPGEARTHDLQITLAIDSL